MNPPPATTQPPDAWRTRSLFAASLLQSVVAVLFVLQWRIEIRDYLADPDQRAIARPFFLHLLITCTTLAHVVMAAAAIAALASRGRPARSRRWFLLGYGIGLPLQIVPHLMPMRWAYALRPELQAESAAVLERFAPLAALGGVIDVLPFTLSVTIGLSRAGLRHLRLYPERPLGATMAFAASLQLGLLATVALVFCEPLLGDHAAALGLCLIVLHYGGAAAVAFLLARARGRPSPWLRRLLTISACALLGPGVVELLLGLWDTRVWDHYLFAWGERPGLVPVADVPQHLLLFVCRSLSTTLAANDLLARSGEAADG